MCVLQNITLYLRNGHIISQVIINIESYKGTHYLLTDAKGIHKFMVYHYSNLSKTLW